MKAKRLIAMIAFALCYLIVSLPILFAQELNLTYDKNGNLVNGDGFFREYNGFNQLSRIRNSSQTGQVLEEFFWSPLEERILIKDVFYKGIKNYTIYYVTPEYIVIENKTGNYTEKYVYQDGQIVAQINTNGQKQFLHNDHEGSNSLVTDVNGNVVENSFYSPFGEILNGGASSRYDYTGKEFDSVVGDYDFNARRYNPAIGKFTQADSIVTNVYTPQALNHFSYVKNNPYRYTDPTGRYEEDVHRELTGFSAKEAGYSADDASWIAAVNQYVDESPDTNPFSSDGIKHYHFQTTAEGQRRAREASDLRALGEALHTLQDSFSHEGYDYSPVRGQFGHLTAGHGPDKTYNDAEKADLMAFATFQALGQQQGWTQGQIINQFIQIYPTIQSFNRAIDSDTKSRILRDKVTIGQKGGSITFERNGQVVGSTWGQKGRGTGNAYCKKGCK